MSGNDAIAGYLDVKISSKSRRGLTPWKVSTVPARESIQILFVNRHGRGNGARSGGSKTSTTASSWLSSPPPTARCSIPWLCPGRPRFAGRNLERNSMHSACSHWGGPRSLSCSYRASPRAIAKSGCRQLEECFAWLRICQVGGFNWSELGSHSAQVSHVAAAFIC